MASEIMKPESAAVMNLPILRHFDREDITLSPKKWRKGERGVATVVGLAALGTLVWGLYSYVLPIVFTWVGQVLGAIAAAVMVIAFFVLLPVLMKALRLVARNLTKALIRQDPFAELETQKQKMVANRDRFKTAKAKIKAIKTTMETESAKAEKEAKVYEEQVLVLQQRAEATKTRMVDMEQRLGTEAAKDSDDYVEQQTSLMRTLSEGQRVGQMLMQSTELVRKYGTRANVIGKLDRKLNMVDTAMEIKIADFDVSIDMLRKEYEFAAVAKQATDEAKSAMHFTKDWQLEYALDVVSNTVALDLASTQENLLDLDALTSQYSTDSDELYSRLDKLADKIKLDAIQIPESRKYSNPNYKLTQQDKLDSPGFGDIFN